MKRLDDHLCAEFGELVMQGARRIIGHDGQTFCQQNRAGIQTGFHLHDANTGSAVTRENRAVNGRRPAPAGQ